MLHTVTSRAVARPLLRLRSRLFVAAAFVVCALAREYVGTCAVLRVVKARRDRRRGDRLSDRGLVLLREGNRCHARANATLHPS